MKYDTVCANYNVTGLGSEGQAGVAICRKEKEKEKGKRKKEKGEKMIDGQFHTTDIFHARERADGIRTSFFIFYRPRFRSD